jgi:hypothetical protein
MLVRRLAGILDTVFTNLHETLYTMQIITGHLTSYLTKQTELYTLIVTKFGSKIKRMWTSRISFTICRRDAAW